MLVNNAGVVQGKLILDLNPQDLYQCEILTRRAAFR